MSPDDPVLRFARLREEDLETVLRWRTRPDIAATMITDIEPDMVEQRRWFARISLDPTVRYWLIRWSGRPVGVVNLAAIDEGHRRCSAGYYVGERDLIQLGALIPPYVYNHVFRDLRMNKIYGEVMATNAAALRMHALHGYRQVGTLRQHVMKRGQFVDMILIELLAEDWLAQERFARYVAVFE